MDRWRLQKIMFVSVALLCGLLSFSALSAAAVERPLQVVATFSIIHDIVEQIGGERVEVHSMVPLGQDPHEYTPLPLDIVKATDADLLFWNGLNMELGDGWFENLLEVTGKSLNDANVVELAKGVEPMYLRDGAKREINPHAFLSVPIAIQYVHNASAALQQADPDYADYYKERTEQYVAQLEALHEQYKEKIGSIPEKRRILVTSERAFQYVAAEYGLREGYVWAIDTDEQGSPQQILELIRFIREHDVRAMFIESNVNPRALETVSRETGVPIVGMVYSDELGKPDEAGGTLLGMLRWNLETIYEGLKTDLP